MLPSQTVSCPYCGELIQIAIDDSVDEQTYIEDCQVCCRPIILQVRVGGDGTIWLQARTENDA